MIQDVEIAANRDGRALGLQVTLTADMGAYLQILTPAVPLLGRYVYPGIYKFDAYDFFCRGVFTTKTPTDSYRGAGPFRRRRSPSSGSWTSWPPSSAWTRWSCDGGTGSRAPSSRTRRSPG